MSLCISASKPNEHWIGVDTAISIKFKGQHYRNQTETTDRKIKIIDNEAYFFSGDLEIILKLQEQFSLQSDRSFESLTHLGKHIFSQYADDGDELAFSKYGFDSNGIAYAQFTNNYLGFKQTDKYYGHINNSFIAYGKNMEQASKLIDLRTVHIEPEFFIPIYEAVADEGVGGEIIVYHLTAEKWGKTDRIKLNEPITIRKLNRHTIKQHYTFVGDGANAFPITIYGEGDGGTTFREDNIIDPLFAGKTMSGKGFMVKPHSSFDMLYFTNNYGHERSMRLKDDEILIKSEKSKIHMTAKNYDIEASEGGVKISLLNGTIFELTPEGDILGYAGRDIKLSAARNIKFSAQQYDFE